MCALGEEDGRMAERLPVRWPVPRDADCEELIGKTGRASGPEVSYSASAHNRHKGEMEEFFEAVGQGTLCMHGHQPATCPGPTDLPAHCCPMPACAEH